jgi:hypothetical protein
MVSRTRKTRFNDDTVYRAAPRLAQQHFPQRRVTSKAPDPALQSDSSRQSTLTQSEFLMRRKKRARNEKGIDDSEAESEDDDFTERSPTSAQPAPRRARSARIAGLGRNEMAESGATGKRRRVMFEIPASSDKENVPQGPNGNTAGKKKDAPAKQRKAKRTDRSRRQSTLTQIDYFQLALSGSGQVDDDDDFDWPKETAARRQRSKSRLSDGELKQTTITQMDFRKRSFDSNDDEIQNHLGYGAMDIDGVELQSRSAKLGGQTEPQEAARAHYGKPRSQPVPDSEDEEEGEFLETQPSRRSPSRHRSPSCELPLPTIEDNDPTIPTGKVHETSDADVSPEEVQVASENPGREDTPCEDEEPSESAGRQNEHIPARLPIPETPSKRKAFEIPSSQTPMSEKISGLETPRLRQAFRQNESPTRLVASSQTPMSQKMSGLETPRLQQAVLQHESPTSYVSSSPVLGSPTLEVRSVRKVALMMGEESIRSPLKELAAHSRISQISPTKKRILEFNARFAELSKAPASNRRSAGGKQTPKFIPSSTRTSGQSNEEENHLLLGMETQFNIGEETQAELRSFTTAEQGETSEDPNAKAVEQNKSPTDTTASKLEPQTESRDFATVATESPQNQDEAEPRNLSSSLRYARKPALELFWPKSSSPIRKEKESQELATDQLLRETQAYMEHQQEGGQGEEEGEVTTPRQSDFAPPPQPISIIGPSQATTVGSPVPTPRSSLRIRSINVPKPSPNALTTSSAPSPVEKPSSSPTQPPSLPTSSPAGSRTSPSGRSARLKQALRELGYDENSISASQLLPESLMNESVPRPPNWAEDDD